MIDFFKTQMDYIYFFYGLAFITLAAVCFIMVKGKKDRLPWSWVGFFALTQGIYEWLDIVKAFFGNSQVLNTAGLFLGVASFIFLIEFGRSGTAMLRGKGTGKWIFVPLLILAGLGVFGGWNSLTSACRSLLGLAGGLWASYALFLASRSLDKAARRWLEAGSISIGLYGITVSLIGPYAPHFPASFVNNEIFFHLFGFPVQLLRGILAAATAISVWAYSQMPSGTTEAQTTRPNRPKNTFVPVVILLGIIMTGWVLTQFAGAYARDAITREGDIYISALANHLTDKLDIVEQTARERADSPAIVAVTVAKAPFVREQALPVMNQCNFSQNTDDSSCYLFDTTGRTLLSYNARSDLGFTVESSFIGNRALQNALKGNFSGSYAIDSASADSSYYASFPVRDAQGGITGVLVVKESLNDIEASFKKLSYCFLVSPEGVVFLSSRGDMRLRSLWPMREDVQRAVSSTGQFGSGPFEPLLSSEAVDGSYVAMDGLEFLVTRRLLGHDRWSIVLLNSIEHIRAYRLFTIFTTFVFFGSTFLFFGALHFTKESATRISASERRYRSLVEGSPDGIVLFDAGGRCLTINNAGLSLFGCTETDVIGKSLSELLSDENPRNLHDDIEQVLQGMMVSFETPLVRSDGERMVGSVILNPVSDPDGQIRRFMGIIMDVTARKYAEEEVKRYHDHLEELVAARTAELSDVNKKLLMEITERRFIEKALRESEQRLHSLFNLASDCILLSALSEDGLPFIMDANVSACTMHGYGRDEIIGKPITFLGHEGSLGEIRRAATRLASGKALTFEVEHLRKDGTIFPVEVSAQMIHLEGKPFILAIARDITERRRAEEELRRHREHLVEMVEERTVEMKTAVNLLTQEITFRKNAEETLKKSEAKFRDLFQQFRTLLDAIPDMLLLLSPDLKILWANRGAAFSLGTEISAMNGKYCYELWHRKSTPCEDCHVIRTFQTGEAEISQRSTAHGKLFESKSFPIKDEVGTVSNVIVIISDITEKTTLQAEAMRASHLASLGELAAGVAHEINNPINGIINYAQILLNKIERERKESEIAGRIIKEGNRIAGIVRSLLSFARERKEEKGPVNIAKILHETITLTEAQIRKDGINLKIDIRPDLPEIIANQQQIQQVFLNVISNARYALNKKYRETYEGKNLDIAGEKFVADGSSYIRVTFHDQGTGIPREILDKVMNPFFSTKPSGEGTGLGLSISHGIVRDHGGRIMLESLEGRFTVVMIDLPLKENYGR
jgi:two-component system, NtrC family, sensor kinase